MDRAYLMWQLTRQRSKRAGIPFDLEPSDIVIPERCPILGIALDGQGTRDSRPDGTPSLDKVIPALGYVKGNVRVISMRANRIKDNATLEEIEAIARYMRESITPPPDPSTSPSRSREAA